MVYTVNYTKRNNFIKDPKKVEEDSDGQYLSESRYRSPGVPKAVTEWVPTYDFRKRKHKIDMSQDELNKLVKELQIYNSEGVRITEAPLRSVNADFWKHGEIVISLPTSGISLNDEIPIEKFWLAVFRSEDAFMFSNDSLSPSKESKVQYTVTPVGQENVKQNEKEDKVFEAMKLLSALEDDTEKMKTILRAMGTDLRRPEPSVIRRALQQKITIAKDQYVAGGHEKNIDMFIRLAKEPTSNFRIKSHITQALSNNVILRKSSGSYFYGDIKLGNNKREVEEFLLHEDNSDVLDEITEKLKGVDED